MRTIKEPDDKFREGFCFFGFGCLIVCSNDCARVCACDCVSESGEGSGGSSGGDTEH